MALGFNNVLLMFSGELNPGWSPLAAEYLGHWKREHLEKGWKLLLSSATGGNTI